MTRCKFKLRLVPDGAHMRIKFYARTTREGDTFAYCGAILMTPEDAGEFVAAQKDTVQVGDACGS